ncbi:unnamed protein product [Candidula unifasciata]|uniref:G-protein coupled receptors family 1 profile domain-containing protein n=1 Tax=Candidula unifasciata TaxID=100452 RepID=A0A8S3YGT2_9EUPU|nr:unnamed protein product [Candidula unifasciata]
MVIYVLPAIILPGLVLNLVSCLVFTSKELKNFSSSIYIFALLVSDTGVLIGLLFVWLEAIGYQVNHLNGVCQVWYVVCITVENYITICHPISFMVMCTKRRAVIVVTCILLLSLLLYIITPIATGVASPRSDKEVGKCWVRSEWMSVMHMMTYLDSLVTLLVPLIAVTGMLITIVLSIIHRSRWKKRLSSLPVLETAEMTPITDSKRTGAHASAQFRVAKMLFALSVSYVIMNSPSQVSRLYYLIRPRNPGDSEMTHSEGLIQLVLLYISYAHHASKFWIFVIVSKNFLKNLKQTVAELTKCRC